MDHSTTSPTATVARAARLAQAGVRFLHAPVFMSPQMCREGKGLIMVSGPSDVFELAQPALARMTGDVWYLGERSDLAAAYKLFGNSMLFAINAGLTDVLAMAKNLGVPGEDAIALVLEVQHRAWRSRCVAGRWRPAIFRRCSSSPWLARTSG